MDRSSLLYPPYVESTASAFERGCLQGLLDQLAAVERRLSMVSAAVTAVALRAATLRCGDGGSAVELASLNAKTGRLLGSRDTLLLLIAQQGDKVERVAAGARAAQLYAPGAPACAASGRAFHHPVRAPLQWACLLDEEATTQQLEHALEQQRGREARIAAAERARTLSLQRQLQEQRQQQRQAMQSYGRDVAYHY